MKLQLSALILISSFALVSAGVFAANSIVTQAALNAAMAHVSCKTNFTAAFIGDLGAAAPQLANLSNYSSALSQDAVQLQAYASADNVTGFRSYVQGTYDPEMLTTRIDVAQRVLNAGLTRSVIVRLRQEWNTTYTAYQSCDFSALKLFADAKVAGYEQILAAYSSQDANLSSRGIDTANLTLIVQNANNAVVQPLQAAINGAKNASQLQAAINGYCLFDGCAGGVNGHVSAYMTWARAQAILGKLESLNKTNATATAQVNADLGSSKAELGLVGTAAYAGSQETVVWSNLTAASALVKKMIISAGGS